jgi:pyrroline-5-carboxylate reductase
VQRIGIIGVGEIGRAVVMGLCGGPLRGGDHRRTPLDRHEALAGLRVDAGKTVVKVMAGVGNDDLRRTLATDAPLVRAIPCPPYANAAPSR